MQYLTTTSRRSRNGRKVLSTLLTGIIAAVFYIGGATATPDEVGRIKHLLHATFDKPQSQLVVDPVVVSGDHAIAGWSQADMGGRALLRLRHGTWSLILCSGDGIKSPEALRHAGVPARDAAELVVALAAVEAKLPRERLALFAKFEGTLMMNADGSHPPVQHAQMHIPASKAFKIGPITIDTPWLRATPKGAQVAGGYMRITNTGSVPDRLVGGTLDRAGRFEIHEMTMVNNVMQMRPLPDGLEIKPGQTVELAPGGFHVMGMALQGGFTEGQTVRGTLRFEKAGTVDIEYAVRPIGAGPQHH
jgi:copper(I)-binding protein